MAGHEPPTHDPAAPATSPGSADAETLVDRLDALERAARPLEPDAAARQRLRERVGALTEAFLRDIDTMPAYVEADDPGAGLLESPIGPRGIPMERVLAHLERDVIHPGGQPASGAHLAYIPGGSIYHAALADYVAAVTNKYSGIFFTGPGPVRMENMVLRWAADLVGYPAGAGGTIASGGSLATLAAVVTAREDHGLKARDYPGAVVYRTGEAHHCVDRALGIAGLGEAQVRVVPVDDRGRMRPDALVEAIRADRAAGLRPWLVVATAGTTNTGAVDPLEPIGEIARAEGCWYHVDAAYGGFFLLTEHGRTLMRGIEASESVVLDPHKGLFMPWGSGIVLVRDVRRLAAAHHAHGDYLQDALAAPGELSPADVSPELSRPFRALRMWLPLQLLGTEPFRAALDEKLLLARYFRREIEAAGFEVGPEPDLSVVTFRWAPPGVAPEDVDRRNRALNDAVRRDGRVFLSSTLVDGRFTLRMAALQFRTHRSTLDLTVRILREEVAP